MDDSTKNPAKQLWRIGGAHGDAENEETGNPTGDPNYRHGSLQWLPHPSRGLRRLKPLTVDTNSPPPFLYSPGYPLSVKGTPSPSSDTPDYFDLGSESLLPPTKVDDNMRFRRCPHLLIYDPERPDDAYAWDLNSRLPAFWDAGDDSDASELLDESTDYITFASRSASMLPELELEVWQLDPPELSPFALDFPEDVEESLEHDPAFADGNSGVIDRLGRPTYVPASEIPVGLSIQPRENSPTLSNIPQLRAQKLSEGCRELEPLPRLSYPESGVRGVPINVPLSPFITGPSPDDTSLYSDLAGGGVEDILVDADWLEGSWKEAIWSSSLEEDLVEWDRWRRQVIDELNRDLDSWAEVRESVRAELD